MVDEAKPGDLVRFSHPTKNHMIGIRPKPGAEHHDLRVLRTYRYPTEEFLSFPKTDVVVLLEEAVSPYRDLKYLHPEFGVMFSVFKQEWTIEVVTPGTPTKVVR